MRIAVLDDYQNVATRFADWSSLDADVEVFTEPFTDTAEVVASLAGFDVLVAMRERTRSPKEVLQELTDLRLLVSTGPANAAIDVSAARQLGITVCGTGYVSEPTVEHTWALILAAARNCLSRPTRCAAAAGKSPSARGCTARPSACWDSAESGRLLRESDKRLV
jgi:phosphoglycerate dehydrogenase-like enzyme